MKTKVSMRRLVNKIDKVLIKNQIGCGYCSFEKICPIKTSDKNRAKLGCPIFEHHTKATGILSLSIGTQNQLREFNDELNIKL